MHELSIALGIIEGVEEELADRPAERVELVHLRLGPLSGVVNDALLFSFEIASAGTRLEGSRLVIEEIPLTIYCTACACERAAVSVRDLRCAACGSPGGDVRHGTELQIFAVEISGRDTADERHAEAG